MAPHNLRWPAHERFARGRHKKERRRDCRFDAGIGMRRKEQRERNDAFWSFLPVHRCAACVLMVASDVASQMGVYLRRVVMVVVAIVEVGVDERRCQRTSLQCDGETDGENAPTHGRDSTGRSCCLPNRRAGTRVKGCKTPSSSASP